MDAKQFYESVKKMRFYQRSELNEQTIKERIKWEDKVDKEIERVEKALQVQVIPLDDLKPSDISNTFICENICKVKKCDMDFGRHKECERCSRLAGKIKMLTLKLNNNENRKAER